MVIHTSQTTSPLSSIAVGVSESEHTIQTTCPYCDKPHLVLLTDSPVQADLVRDTLKILSEVPSYRTRAPRESKRLLMRGKQERANGNETAAATHPAEYVSTPRPRYRYYAVDRRKNPDILSPTRRKVYAAIARAEKSGVIAQELVKKGFPHGTVQQTLHWLRHNNWVKHDEETVND